MRILTSCVNKQLINIISAVTFLGSACTAIDTSSYTVEFDCERLGKVNVTFDDKQESAIVLLRGDNLVLLQQPAASGFYYSNGKTSIRGKGQVLTIEIGRMAPIQCANFK